MAVRTPPLTPNRAPRPIQGGYACPHCAKTLVKSPSETKSHTSYFCHPCGKAFVRDNETRTWHPPS